MIFEPLLFKGYVRFPGSDSGKALLFDNNNSSSNNKDKGSDCVFDTRSSYYVTEI